MGEFEGVGIGSGMTFSGEVSGGDRPCISDILESVKGVKSVYLTEVERKSI